MTKAIIHNPERFGRRAARAGRHTNIYEIDSPFHQEWQKGHDDEQEIMNKEPDHETKNSWTDAA